MSMGFSKQEYWSGDTISSSRGSSWPRDWTRVLHYRQIIYYWFTREVPEVRVSDGGNVTIQDLDQWSRPELNLVHSRHLALAGWMSDYHMTSFTSLMFCDGIQLLSTLVYILDKWNPFLNDEMITQNVLSLPLSLSRIKKPVPVSLHGFDIYIHACVLSHFSHECLLQRYGLLSTRLLCPWDSPGKNTGVGCHVLLQGIFQPRDHTLISCSSCTAGSFFTAGKEESPCVVSVCTLIFYIALSSFVHEYLTGDIIRNIYQFISLWPPSKS